MSAESLPSETSRAVSPVRDVPCPSAHPTDMGDLTALLRNTIELGGSDLHLSVGRPPTARILGALSALHGCAVLLPEQARNLILPLMSEGERQRFEREQELDTAFAVAGLGRFRVNVFVQRGSLGAVFRVIPHDVPRIDLLGLPEIVRTFAALTRGLVLVTGPTGSGKSTTLASIVDVVNRERAVHVMTIEDPIEFLHPHKRALVNQREVGQDTRSFADGLRHVLRQDPDVILVGELRDLESIMMALTAAETGHLVLASLHSQDASGAIDRIIDVFPADQQRQVRVQLVETLRAVVAQVLIARADGLGMIPAVEVLTVTPAVRNLIRENKLHQLVSVMQSGSSHGMKTLDQALATLVRSGEITIESAEERSNDPDALRLLVNDHRGW